MKKYSKLSIVSFIFALVCPISLFFSFSEDASEDVFLLLFLGSLFLLGVSFILALIAIFSKNSAKLKGLWMAKLTVFISILFAACFLFFVTHLPI